MKSVSKIFLVLTVLALAFFTMPMSAQKQAYPSPDYPFPGYPEQFSPRRTGRPRPPTPAVPAAKFIRLEKAVPNEYIVVLNDNVVSTSGTAPQRRARIADFARQILPAGSEIKSVYGTVLRGFCVKLPSEAAAIALTKDSRVKYVESDGVDGVPTTCQSSAPVGLDRIDQMDLPLDTYFCSNQTGSGVTVYDVGPGVRTTHNEFGSRAFIATDIVASHSVTDHCTVTSTNNDCEGHGTAMLGVVGGSTYGVAKSASLGSVKVWYLNNDSPTPHEVFVHSYIVEGIEWITDHHNDNPSQLEVANCSFMTGTDSAINGAVIDSINAGVTYAIGAGNRNVSLDWPDDPNASPTPYVGVTPAQVGHVALIAGAENPSNDYRWVDSSTSGSDYGSKVSVFSPSVGVTSADSSSDSATSTATGGASRASAHTAGVAALYLQGRTGMNGCGSHPLDGPSSSTTGAAIATCPDRVNQFVMANSTLSRLATSGSGAIGTGSPNRLLYTGSIPTTTNFNPIDNQRFFVWQHYGDFVPTNSTTNEPQPEPDEAGLDWWTSEITGHGHGCDAGVNNNNSCTNTWRDLDSRAFWVATHGSWFTTSYGLSNFDPTPYATQNEKFLDAVYHVYLRRAPNDPPDYNYDGLNSWRDDLNAHYGNPANADGVLHIIDAFLHSTEYRQRFGG